MYLARRGSDGITSCFLFFVFFINKKSTDKAFDDCRVFDSTPFDCVCVCVLIFVCIYFLHKENYY